MNTSATQGKRSVQAIKRLIGKMPLWLCTKVMQPMQHFCIKNVACNDTLGAKRYIIINYQLDYIRRSPLHIFPRNALYLTNNKQQTTNNKQQTTNNKQQITNNKQQITNNKQQITNNKQQITNHK